MATKTRTARTPFEVKHVAPTRPDRSKFPAGVEGTRKYREAESAYEMALLAYAAEAGIPDHDGDIAAIEAAIETTDAGGNVAPVEEKPRRRTRSAKNAAEVKAAEKKTPALKAPAKKATGAKAADAKKAPAKTLDAPEGFKSWTDPKLATAVVRMKTKEKKTIKAIAEALGLPAEHRSWFAVSKVWRETADAKGIDRPRLSPEAIEARKAKKAEK